MVHRWLGSAILVVIVALCGVLFFIVFQNQKELSVAFSQQLKGYQDTPAPVQVIEKVVVQQPWGPVQTKAKDTVVQIIAQISEVNILKPFETPSQHPVAGTGFFITWNFGRV